MKVKDPPSENKAEEENKSGLPIRIPMTIIRWMCYSLFFSGLLNAFLAPPFNITLWQWAASSLLLGHFAGQLNGIINKTIK